MMLQNLPKRSFTSFSDTPWNKPPTHNPRYVSFEQAH